jgi:hypothetical protein
MKKAMYLAAVVAVGSLMYASVAEANLFRRSAARTNPVMEQGSSRAVSGPPSRVGFSGNPSWMRASHKALGR